MKNAAYEKIKKAGELPSPSGVALELIRLVDDDASTLAQVTAAVEVDPALAMSPSTSSGRQPEANWES